jgi:hypothetical protein
MKNKKGRYLRAAHMQEIKEQAKPDEKEVEPDTSDIAEVGEDWFKEAKLQLPDEKKE